MPLFFHFSLLLAVKDTHSDLGLALKPGLVNGTLNPDPISSFLFALSWRPRVTPSQDLVAVLIFLALLRREPFFLLPSKKLGQLISEKSSSPKR